MGAKEEDFLLFQKKQEGIKGQLGWFPPTHTVEGESVPQSGTPWDRHTHKGEDDANQVKKEKFLCVSLSDHQKNTSWTVVILK